MTPSRGPLFLSVSGLDRPTTGCTTARGLPLIVLVQRAGLRTPHTKQKLGQPRSLSDLEDQIIIVGTCDSRQGKGDNLGGTMPRLSPMVQMPMNPHLPVRKTIGRGVDALIDFVRQEDEGPLYTFITKLVGEEGSLIKDQFQNERQWNDLLKQGVNICCKDMGDNGRLFAFLNVTPSPLCRSNVPTLHAGYGIVEAAYRSKGVFGDLLFYWGALALREGYNGTLARNPVISTGGYLSSKRGGAHFTGCIPDGVLTGNNEYTDDLVTYLPYGDMQSIYKAAGFIVKNRTPEHRALPLMRTDAVDRLCHPGGPFETQIQELFSASDKTVVTGRHVRLELAGEGAIGVERAVRRAAENGEGFALDEFDDDGLLNRKFLRESVTLVARRLSDSALVGGAIVGPSNLQRASKPNSLGSYLVVSERFRGNGYGSDIADICEKICEGLGFSHIISDILYSPAGQPALRMAMRKGYILTGQLPGCAFVKDVGMTGSFLVFKSLRQGSKI